MREQLKRELNKTYLILTSENEMYEESYELEMIIRNEPKQILPLRVLRIDGQIELCYEISSKQTLKDCAKRVKFSADIIRSLFEAVEKLISEIGDYLLEMENVLLDLEHIYTKEGQFYFCYCPWKSEDVMTAFRGMLEEILADLDYHDTEGVALAYHLYQSACKGDFPIEQILKEHCTKEEKDSECEDEIYFGQEEEFRGWPLENCVDEREENIQKPGILKKILTFFLKKEVIEEGREQKTDTGFYYESYDAVPSVIHEDTGYTKVLEPSDGNTILLGNMPVGSWRLRPLMAGYEEFWITTDNFLIGKKKDSVDGYISRDSVSRIHSRLYVRDRRLFITDANSTNGTFVNGAAIAPGEEAEIFAGDRILFADVGYECYNSL